MERDVCGEFAGLRYNPLQIFKASKTPAGLYARQKWRDEAVESVTRRRQSFAAHRTAMGPGAAKIANGTPFLSSMP